MPVYLWSSVGSLWHFMIAAAPWSCATFCRHIVHLMFINHWFFCMFRSQFIESSIVYLKVCSSCVIDTPVACTVLHVKHDNACLWWCVLDVLLEFPGTVFWKWFVSVMRCKDLYWVGPCRESNLNLWTHKWLFFYTVNMKSHQQREEQKSYQ